MEGYLMFRSMTCSTVAFVLVLALVLSTVPAQAQPRDFGSQLDTLDASWLDAAFSWLGDLVGGGDTDSLQSLTTKGKFRPVGRDLAKTGSCIDPFGQPIVPCVDIP
jgi:hypothetical protein